MKYKLSVVSYVNTIPFIYGLKQYGLDKKLDISLDIPSTCAEKLLSREVDIGLVPIVFFETSLQAQFVIPMAVSLAFGVLFATVVTLVLIPSLYLIIEDMKKALARKKHNEVKTQTSLAN